MRTRRATILLVALAALCCPMAASAASPGSNGLIAFLRGTTFTDRQVFTTDTSSNVSGPLTPANMDAERPVFSQRPLAHRARVPAGQPTVRADIRLAGAIQASLCLTKASLCYAGDSVRPLIVGSYVKHHARRGRLRLQASVSRRELRYLRHRHIHRLRHATLVITIVPRHGGAVTVIQSRPFTIRIRQSAIRLLN